MTPSRSKNTADDECATTLLQMCRARTDAASRVLVLPRCAPAACRFCPSGSLSLRVTRPAALMSRLHDKERARYITRRCNRQPRDDESRAPESDDVAMEGGIGHATDDPLRQRPQGIGSLGPQAIAAADQPRHDGLGAALEIAARAKVAPACATGEHFMVDACLRGVEQDLLGPALVYPDAEFGLIAAIAEAKTAQGVDDLPPK